MDTETKKYYEQIKKKDEKINYILLLLMKNGWILLFLIVRISIFRIIMMLSLVLLQMIMFTKHLLYIPIELLQKNKLCCIMSRFVNTIFFYSIGGKLLYFMFLFFRQRTTAFRPEVPTL